MKYVEHHHNAILASEAKFPGVSSKPSVDKIEDGHVRCFIDWSLDYGAYAKKVLTQQTIQREIDQITDQITEQKLKSDRVSHMLESLSGLDIN